MLLTLHRLVFIGAFTVALFVFQSSHELDHLLVMRRFVHIGPAISDHVYAALSFKFSKQVRIIGFRVHGKIIHLFFDMKRFQPHAFGFVGAVSHSQKAA